MKFFSLIQGGDVHPSSDEKVIPAAVFSKLIEAMDIVEKAKEDAEKHLESARQEGERLKKAAEDAGASKGLEAFNEKILEMDQALKKVRHEMQTMVLPLALQAAKKIVSKELETYPDTIVDIVQKAIAPVTESRQVIIYVSRQDKEALDQSKGIIQEMLPHVDALSIQEKEMSPGSCIIKTEAGMINASIDNQWKALERAFTKFFNRPAE